MGSPDSEAPTTTSQQPSGPLDIDTGSQVSVNSKLSSWIEKINNSSLDDDKLRQQCTEFLQNRPRSVPLSLVKKIAVCASQWEERGKTPKSVSAYTDDFLDGAKWYFAEGPAPQKRDFENESTVQRIRNDAAAREYARMTKNVGFTMGKKCGEGFGFAAEMKTANKESMAVFNCLLTVLGAGVFAFFATGLAIGDNLVAQVLVAVLVSCVVAIADIYFLLTKLHRSDVEEEEKRRVLQGKQEVRGASQSVGPYEKSKDD